MVDIISVVGVLLGFAALGYIVYLAAHPDAERHDEDDARKFFDENGRWPDEPASAAVPSSTGSYADVDLLPPPRT